MAKKFQYKTVCAFLKSKGWKEEAIDNGYIPMKPLSKVKAEIDTRFYIPHENLMNPRAYQERMSLLVQSIALLYELDIFELQWLFSKTIDEIKTSVTQQQAILAVAS